VKLTTIAGLTALSLLAACGPLEEMDGLETSDATIVADDSEHDGKADRADIALVAVTGVTVPSSVGQTTTRVVFRTASSFKSYFGLRSTPIDFNSYWVGFYSAGVQRTGGYKASVTRVRLDDAGTRLKMTTRLESPGTGCIVTQALTKPFALVKFKKPRPAAQATLFYKSDTSRNCEPPTPPCATVRCAAGYHCVDTDGTAACVANATCAATLCGPNTFCYEGDGGAQCVPFQTCAGSSVSCAAGTHCEDRPIVCVRAPCAPTAPACIENACTPAAYTPAARELVGTFSNTATTPYARNYKLGADGSVNVEDLVAPCPAGATCFWSGIVTRNGYYAQRGSTITITYNRDSPQGFDLEYYATLRVVKSCGDSLITLVEDHSDGTKREFKKQ